MSTGARVFIALDADKVAEVVKNTSGRDCGYKFGLKQIHRVGPPQIVAELHNLGARELFCDAKLHDIHNTVGDAVRVIAKLGVGWTNVMCLGGRKMMQAAVAARDQVYAETGQFTGLLGVTILTSHDFESLLEMGILTNPLVESISPLPENYKQNLIKELVVLLAKLAQDSGLEGVIASPREATAIRAACGPEFEIVTPGIRSINDPPDDQKRTATATEAIYNGATRIVVGRPILNAPNQFEAACQFIGEVDIALQGLKARA